MEDFYAAKIDDHLFSRINGISYRQDCTLPLADLRYLHVLHRDLRGNVREGEMICNACIVHGLLEIFYALYEAAYPIEKIGLVDLYGGEDEASMRDNNSSCFNFRFISHTHQISKHGLGLAVDINPLYNPYSKKVQGKWTLEPATAAPYLDRSQSFPYKIEDGDLCCQMFLRHGFEWGGNWEDRKDYQHFEISDRMVEILYPGRQA